MDPINRIARQMSFALLAAGLWCIPAVAHAAEQAVRIVVLGDSLAAGFGLAREDSFPAKLGQALAARRIAADVLNAGVSGDTTTGGLARVDWSVPEGTDAVIVELGANDALRGVEPQVAKSALDGIIRRLKARGIAILLAGMKAPRNYGPQYAASFDAIYPDLAAKHDVALYPFFLEGVATQARLNQPDGLHPTAAGIDVIVERILPQVEALIAQVQAHRGR